MIRRQLVLMAFGALLAGGVIVAKPAHAGTAIDHAIDEIRDSGGHYARASASLTAADCSGLVSVAQTLAMGQAPHRLGDTHSLLAGRWPGAIPGASPGDEFVIGVSPAHMVARIDGVGIEARQSGELFRVGADAASPWAPQFTRQYHIDSRLFV